MLRILAVRLEDVDDNEDYRFSCMDLSYRISSRTEKESVQAALPKRH